MPFNKLYSSSYYVFKFESPDTTGVIYKIQHFNLFEKDLQSIVSLVS